MKAIHKLSLCVLSCFVLFPLAQSQNPPIQEEHGIVASSIDASVKPGDDFYRFANGNWINRAEIPADRAAVDVWTKLGDLSNQRMADLIKEIASSNEPAGSGLRKVADLYNSYMDEAAIESKGVAPLKARLDAIAAIKDKTDQLTFTVPNQVDANTQSINDTEITGDGQPGTEFGV